jgi:hypothetical protein
MYFLRLLLKGLRPEGLLPEGLLPEGLLPEGLRPLSKAHLNLILLKDYQVKIQQSPMPPLK